MTQLRSICVPTCSRIRRLLLSTVLSAWAVLDPTPLSAQLLSNAGFESGFAGWTTSQGSGAAVFATPTSAPSPYVGSYYAQISVSSAGAPNHPSLSTTFTADPDETYLLRWFAQCSVNRAGMKIQVNSAGPAYAAAAFNPSSNGWEAYQYAFRASGVTTVTITFEQSAVYRLDELQLYDTENGLDHTGTRMDPERHFLWRWGQGTNLAGRLMNTDNDVSAPLPDGRVAWIFNDTYTGHYDPYDNSGGTDGFVRNFLVIQDGDTLTPWTPGQTSFQPATSGNWYWPNDAFVEGNKLKIVHHEVSNNGGYGAFVASAVATLSLPGLTLDGISGHTPWNINKVLDAADGYLYLIGGLNGPGDHGLARVVKGDFDNFSAWRYWNGSDWVADSSSWVAMGNLDGLWSMARIGPGNFVAISAGFVGSSWRASFASSPTGPWTNPEANVIGYPPVDFEAETSFYYMPYLHRDTVQNGVYSVGFSDIGPSGADGDGPFLSNRPGADQCHYNIQYFLTPNLLDLSPHTTYSYSDSFEDNDPVEWKTYGGNWVAASGRYATTGDPDGARAVALGVLNESVIVEAHVASGSGGNAGVLFRGSEYRVGPDNFRGYYAAIEPGSGVVLARMDGGSRSTLATAAMTITSGVTYPMKVVAEGSLIEVFVTDMDTPKISTSDTNYVGGSSGLCADSASAAWYDFAIIDIPGPPSPPVAHLRFDETSGPVAADSSGNGWDGALHNQAAWGAGCVNNAVFFDGNEDYVTFAPGVVNGLTDFTIAAWVKWNGGSDWQRVWDFGTGTDRYTILTPRSGGGVASFEITVAGGFNKQVIDAPGPLPIGQWTHVAVTLANSTGTLYIDGAPVNTEPITLTPSSMGVTTANYLGKSQYSNDAELNGALDEFLIYDRALSSAEITALVTPRLSIVPAGAMVEISWTPDPGTGWVLQETAGVSPAGWINAPSGSTNPAMVPPNGATKLYRVSKP